MKICVCGCEDYRPLRTYRTPYGPIEMVLCSNCDLARNLIDYDYEEIYSDEAGVYEVPDEAAYASQLHRMRMYLNYVSRHTAEVGSMLDIGCNAGQLMEVFKEQGWDTTGIDLNPSMASYAQARGLNVKCGTIVQCDFPDAAFDLVTVAHTLEHVPALDDVISDALRILKPGGLLFAAVPNFDCLSERLVYRDRWPVLLPQQHIWYFTKTTLAGTLTRYALEALRVSPLASHPTEKGSFPEVLARRLAVTIQRLANDGNEVVGVFQRTA